MESEPLVYREEVAGILIALADINANIGKILDVLWRVYGEEEDPEDDS